MAEERDLLMTNYTNLAEKRDRLDKRLDELGEHESNDILYLNENVEKLKEHEYDQ